MDRHNLETRSRSRPDLDLVVGAVFKTYSEFTSVLDSYCQTNRVVFIKKNATTVECVNKIIQREAKRYPAAWRYKSVQFQCKHFGTYASQSQGCRPDTDTFKCDCKAKIRLHASKAKNGLVITEVNLVHSNHPDIDNETAAMVYPECRQISADQQKEIFSFFGMKVSAGTIVRHFKEQYGIQLQVQDVHNHKLRYKKEQQKGLTEDDATSLLFSDILAKDPGASIEVICDTKDTASVIFFQTSQMKQSFHHYSSILFLDTTYKVNCRSMPLFSIMAVDGDNSGVVVGYGLVINECAETITKLMEVFVKHNVTPAQNVKTVIVDKDFSEIRAVKNVLPNCKIILCKFHVLQALQRALKGYETSEKECGSKVFSDSFKLLR